MYNANENNMHLGGPDFDDPSGPQIDPMTESEVPDFDHTPDPPPPPPKKDKT